ncbi:cytochrome P450 93G1-like [Phoenix dactylifera]|uniref:Cytochrome P450 93G1-like n=1 Tax=Phoenix dactylifera TaxID=42345 RepID=A0A8B7D5N3_PHODC|nr:cytochrome P450 93G1-like [Phoenix dactylifera]
MGEGGFGSPAFFLLLAISLVSVLFLATLSKARSGRRRLPPGPLSLPVIGHLHLLRPPVHQTLYRLATRHGPIFTLRLGSALCVIASSPDLARELFKTHDTAISNRPQTAAARHFAYDAAGFAFAPYGPYWRFVKRLCMSELLGPRTVDLLRPVRRVELLDLLRAVLDKSARREPVDMSSEIIKMTNNEVTRMAASTTSSGAGGETKEARELVKQVAELVGAFNIADYIGFCKNLDLQGLGKRVREVHRRFDALMERIIRGKEEKRRRRKEMGCGGEDEVKDLLDILLDVAEDDGAEMKLSRENIKGFILDIFTAGSDSSAATIEWGLAELINHPEALEKVREEIDRVVGKDRLVGETDLPKLPYLQAAMKETMRLHPAAPVAHRQTTKDIHVGGYDIPADTVLMVNLWAIGRDPSYWEDPLEFRPERFMSDAAAVDVRGQHFQLLPFGSGRRGCPGMVLAMQVVSVTVAAMVQSFEWEVVGGEAVGEGRVDMEEKEGLVAARQHPLVLVPVARLDPFPALA